MTAGPSAIARADVSRLLFLDGTAARLIVALFVSANAVFTVTTADRLTTPWPAYVAMILVSCTAALLVRSRPDPFPWPDTVTVLIAVIVSSALISFALPDTGAMGRATWHLGSNTWLLFFLALRRRALAAWIGMGAMVIITAAWGIESGRGPAVGFTMVQSHMGILLVGTLFALILRRTSVRINEFNERSVRSAMDAAATDATRQVRRARVSELATVAVPLLEKVASGAELDAKDRLSFALTEAQLRDSVRARSLALPAVVDAASAARKRGVEVVLLDDRGASVEDGTTLSRMVNAVVSSLNAATGGRVTARLLPAGRSVAMTVVAVDGDEVVRRTLGPDGLDLDLEDA